MQAAAIMPRSPTLTMSSTPNVGLIWAVIYSNAAGSAVFLGRTRTATGQSAGG